MRVIIYEGLTTKKKKDADSKLDINNYKQKHLQTALEVVIILLKIYLYR